MCIDLHRSPISLVYSLLFARIKPLPTLFESNHEISELSGIGDGPKLRCPFERMPLWRWSSGAAGDD